MDFSRFHAEGQNNCVVKSKSIIIKMVVKNSIEQYQLTATIISDKGTRRRKRRRARGAGQVLILIPPSPPPYKRFTLRPKIPPSVRHILKQTHTDTTYIDNNLSSWAANFHYRRKMMEETISFQKLELMFY